MAPPSHYVEVFKLLDGGLRDGGWTGEGRPKGGHALAILPGLPTTTSPPRRSSPRPPSPSSTTSQAERTRGGPRVALHRQNSEERDSLKSTGARHSPADAIGPKMARLRRSARSLSTNASNPLLAPTACGLRHLGVSNARPATGGHGRCQPDTAGRLGRASGWGRNRSI
jgi:hypothetical protein